MGVGIKTDKAGNIYVAGSTASDNFPTTSGAIQRKRADEDDVFIIRFGMGNADLSLTKTVNNSAPYVGG